MEVGGRNRISWALNYEKSLLVLNFLFLFLMVLSSIDAVMLIFEFTFMHFWRIGGFGGWMVELDIGIGLFWHIPII